MEGVKQSKAKDQRENAVEPQKQKDPAVDKDMVMVTSNEACPVKPVEVAPAPTPRHLIDLESTDDEMRAGPAPEVVDA